MKKEITSLRAAAKHYDNSPGTPYISDGDSARVLFFFNLSGAYGGNEGAEQAKKDAHEIARRYNDYPEVIEVLEDLLRCEKVKRLLEARKKRVTDRARDLVARKK